MITKFRTSLDSLHSRDFKDVMGLLDMFDLHFIAETHLSDAFAQTDNGLQLSHSNRDGVFGL